MKENWVNDMKQKLEGHKMSPPTGLWESISNEMGCQESSASKTIAFKRWYWAVAAAILALIGYFVIDQFNPDKPLPQVSYTPQASEPPVTIEESQEDQPLALAEVPQHTRTKITPGVTDEIIQENIEEVSQQEVEEPEKNEEEEPQQTSMVTSRQPHTESYNHYSPNYQIKQNPTSTSASKWSIGLNASGGLLASSNPNRKVVIYSSYYTSEYIYNYTETTETHLGFSNQEPNDPELIISEHTSYTLTDYVSNHHLPVSIGLSLNYQLSPHLALLSGINYTYLYSEFYLSLYPNVRRNQKLHYLGIPVGVSWHLWKANGFSLYLSGSTMLEKCLNEKPWQWSVSAGAGAEYAITPLFGVYFEPSLGYYFNDGTSFEHYYKEHPLAPSIEFGIRLHLNNK